MGRRKKVSEEIVWGRGRGWDWGRGGGGFWKDVNFWGYLCQDWKKEQEIMNKSMQQMQVQCLIGDDFLFFLYVRWFRRRTYRFFWFCFNLYVIKLWLLRVNRKFYFVKISKGKQKNEKRLKRRRRKISHIILLNFFNDRLFKE